MTSDPATWVDAHGDRLFRYALSRIRDERAAEDLVQDALITAFKARIAGWFEQLPEIFQCSSETGRGRSELLAVISRVVDAGPAEPEPEPPAAPLPPEPEPPFHIQVRAGQAREKLISLPAASVSTMALT